MKTRIYAAPAVKGLMGVKCVFTHQHLQMCFHPQPRPTTFKLIELINYLFCGLTVQAHIFYFNNARIRISDSIVRKITILELMSSFNGVINNNGMN